MNAASGVARGVARGDALRWLSPRGGPRGCGALVLGRWLLPPVLGRGVPRGVITSGAPCRRVLGPEVAGRAVHGGAGKCCGLAPSSGPAPSGFAIAARARSLFVSKRSSRS